MNEKRYLKIAYAVITLSFFTRIIIAFYFSDNWLTPDSENYILQANELLKGGFGLYFPNGFPALIALVTTLVGTAARDYSMIVVNLILSTASLYIFNIIVRNYIGVNYFSLIAIALFAFYPNQLNYVRFILTEVPSVFFLVLSFYLISKNKFSTAGLMLGLAAIMKTSLLGLLVLFSFYLFYKKEFQKGIKFLISSLLPVALMSIYGLIITGVFTIGYSSEHSFYLAVNQPELLSTNILDSITYYLNHAFSHPLKFIYERFQSLWDFWGFLPFSGEGLRSNLLLRLIIGIRFPLLLLALYGFYKSPKDTLVVFSLLIMIALTLMHFVFYSNPRYNFAAEPFLFFLAVIGLKYFFEKHLNKES
jgi:hypothetical protein